MKKMFVKKLNEDDILEILIEHFQEGKYAKSEGCAKIYGLPGQDLRALVVVNHGSHKEINLDEIEKNIEYNGDHHFLIGHPEFDLSRHFKNGDTGTVCVNPNEK